MCVQDCQCVQIYLVEQIVPNGANQKEGPHVGLSVFCFLCFSPPQQKSIVHMHVDNNGFKN